MSAISLDPYKIFSDVMTFLKYEYKKNRKVTIFRFFKEMEHKWKIKLTTDDKERLLNDLDSQGKIRIVGKRYIILNPDYGL